MKQLQVILTIEVTNDQYSEIINDSTDIETILHHAMELGENTYSLDFPAVVIPKFSNERT